MAKNFCVHCGEELPAVAKFCSSCGKKIESDLESADESQPQAFDWVFAQEKTGKYDNRQEDLRSYLGNHKVKDVRKFFAKGLELHFPQTLNEKLFGDEDEYGNFVFWEHKLALKYKGLHQLQENVGWGNRDYAFLTENYLVLVNDSINLMMVAKNKDLFHVIKWDEIDQIVVALDSYVEKGFATIVEWHWRIQFQLASGQVYERLLYIGMNEKGYNENINSSQYMLGQMGHLCGKKGKPNIILLVEGSSVLNDMTPKFGFGVFKEI